MTLLQTKLLQISPATLLAGHRRRKYFVPVTSDTYCLLMADAVLWTQFRHNSASKNSQSSIVLFPYFYFLPMQIDPIGDFLL